jgi:hypothetical protein
MRNKSLSLFVIFESGVTSASTVLFVFEEDAEVEEAKPDVLCCVSEAPRLINTWERKKGGG